MIGSSSRPRESSLWPPSRLEIEVDARLGDEEGLEVGGGQVALGVGEGTFLHAQVNGEDGGGAVEVEFPFVGKEPLVGRLAGLSVDDVCHPGDVDFPEGELDRLVDPVDSPVVLKTVEFNDGLVVLGQDLDRVVVNLLDHVIPAGIQSGKVLAQKLDDGHHALVGESMVIDGDAIRGDVDVAGGEALAQNLGHLEIEVSEVDRAFVDFKAFGHIQVDFEELVAAAFVVGEFLVVKVVLHVAFAMGEVGEDGGGLGNRKGMGLGQVCDPRVVGKAVANKVHRGLPGHQFAGEAVPPDIRAHEIPSLGRVCRNLELGTFGHRDLDLGQAIHQGRAVDIPGAGLRAKINVDVARVAEVGDTDDPSVFKFGKHSRTARHPEGEDVLQVGDPGTVRICACGNGRRDLPTANSPSKW